MKWLKEHVVAVLLFAVPIMSYYYAIRYEIDYLQYFHVNAAHAQLNPVVILNLFYFFQLSLIILLSLIIVVLLTLIGILKLQAHHPQFIPKNKVPHQILRQIKIPLTVWIILFGIPLLNGFMADYFASNYIQKPTCINLGRKEKTVLVRQYGNSMIVKDVDKVGRTIVLDDDYRIVDASTAKNITPDCRL